MKSLYKEAILKAGQVRREVGADMFQPINIFDTCLKLGVDVKFVDVNMEGFYVNQGTNATILISSMRPFPRRCFTCAHELGHHKFGHGTKVDMLSSDNEPEQMKDPDEILVDAFAAALLMPIGGVQAEFAKRKWDIEEASPLAFYTIASLFGVGYQTLVTHCKANKLITANKFTALSRLTPAKIFEQQFGQTVSRSYFKVIDAQADVSTVDLEIHNHIVLPCDVAVEGDLLEKVKETSIGCLYIANKAGICTVNRHYQGSSFFIRIQKENYVGLAAYRHFEN